MSKLSDLREALEKLDEAETALLKARNAFRSHPAYSRLDGQYEVVGDAAQIVRDILGREESALMQAVQHDFAPDAGYALCKCSPSIPANTADVCTFCNRPRR
jgi:hypothetical protein